MLLETTTQILMENAKTFVEKDEIMALTESDKASITDSMISALYNGIVDKGYIDYGDIPLSGGDITKYSGYATMVGVLEGLEKLIPSGQRDAKEDIREVQKAIENIALQKNTFIKGFKLKKDFVILQYNTLVMACVTATSLLSITCVDYVRNPQGDYEVHPVVRKENPGLICLTNLKKFNKEVASGNFVKALNFVMDNEKEAFVGTATGAIMVVMGAIIVLTLSARELVYLYYSRRVKLEMYLRQQAAFLESNRLWVESNTALSAERQREVIMNQNATAQQLIAMADKIAVDNKIAERDSLKLVQTENKSLNLKELQTDRMFKLA